MESCLFCKIVEGTEPSEKILETGSFLVIGNQYPVAPVHVLVLSKVHHEKSKTLFGEPTGFWDEMFQAIGKTVKKLNLHKTGYKLVNNGAGYNHFEHEHTHILGGSKKEPGGKTWKRGVFYMVKVNVKKDESLEQALRRFNREVSRERIIQEVRERQYYERPSQARKRAAQLKRRGKDQDMYVPEVRPVGKERKDD